MRREGEATAEPWSDKCQAGSRLGGSLALPIFANLLTRHIRNGHLVPGLLLVGRHAVYNGSLLPSSTHPVELVSAPSELPLAPLVSLP